VSFFSELKRRNVIRVATAYAVTAWVIIQVVETVLPFFGLSGDAIRSLIVLLAIGFVPAVVLAWVFQLTPEGIRRDSGAMGPESDPATSRLLDRAIILVLVIGISYFAFDKFVLAPERAAEREAEVVQQTKAATIVGYYGDRSIAVLPFENNTGDPAQDNFVDGIADELLNLLAKIRQLRVISRSSSFALRGLDLDVPEIGRRLDVAHVLEGSVSMSGRIVRVRVHLIEARTDTQLWSNSYEHELDDVFAIQDEIAADVAKNLKIELLRPLPQSRMIDPEALALAQQGRQLFERQAPDAGLAMSQLIEQAINIDPNYASVWKLKVHADFLLWQEGRITADEQLQRYDQSLLRIHELEPDSGFIDMLDGVDAVLDGRFEDAAMSFARSIAKDPSDSEAARLAGRFAREIGRFDTAIRLGRHAVAIDPLCYTCLYQLSRTYMYAGDYDAAAAMRRRFLALAQSGGQYHFGLILLLQGRPDEALAHYRSLEPGPHRQAGVAMAFHDLGNTAGAQEAFHSLLTSRDEGIELLVAEVAAWMDQRDLAFAWLQKAIDKEHVQRSETMNPLGLLNPVYRNLHSDARWDDILESTGYAPERLAAIEFDPELPQ